MRDDLKEILRVVSEYSQVYIDDIISKKRSTNIKIARHRYCYLARTMTNYSLKEIGEVIGGKDHTTVMYAVKEISHEISKNKLELKTIREMEGLISIEHRPEEDVYDKVNKTFGELRESFEKLLKQTWEDGFEKGKKSVKPVTVERVKIKKIYVFTEQEETKTVKQERHKGVYSNRQFS